MEMSSNGIFYHEPSYFAARDWLHSHIIESPNKIYEFLSGDNLNLSNINILDVGTGDGLIAGAFANLTNNRIVGIDYHEFDWDFFHKCLSAKLERNNSDLFDYIKLESNSSNWNLNSTKFDLIISWSVLEHVFDIANFFKNITEHLNPNGKVFLQTYPLWQSRWGHHLYRILPEFFHIDRDLTEIRDYLSTKYDQADPTILEMVENSDILKNLSYPEVREKWLNNSINLLSSCNKLQISEIFDAIHLSGLKVRKFEIISSGMHVPDGMKFTPEIAIEGFYVLLDLGK